MSIGEALGIIRGSRKRINRRKLISYAKVFRGMAKKLKVAFDD
jgi:hypothetical protein